LATQELKTEIVLNAQSAINNMNALKTALESINTMNFSSLAKAFGSLESAAKTFAEQSKNISAVEKEQAKEQNKLLAEKKKILGEISKLYSDNNGNLGKAETAELNKMQESLAKVVRKIADMKEAMGNLGGAKNEFQTAFASLENIGIKNIKQLDDEYKSFIKTLEVTKEKMRALQEQAVKDSRVQEARALTGRDDKTKQAEEEKRLKDTFNATKRRFENLLAGLQDKVKAHTNKGDGLVYTEKELSADRRNLEKIVRDFNDAMKNLGMSERWGTGELVPNSKKKKNPLYNNPDINGRGFFQGVNVSPNGNNQSQQSKIDRLKSNLEDIRYQAQQRTSGSQFYQGLSYSDNKFASTIAKAERYLKLLEAIDKKTADIERKATMDALNNADRVKGTDVAEQKLKRLNEMMANLKAEMDRLSKAPILDTQVNALENKFNRIRDMIMKIDSTANHVFDRSKFDIESAQQRKQRLAGDKANQKSQLYEDGTKAVYEQIKNLEKYKQNIALVTAELNKLNQAELKMSQQANSGTPMKAADYQKIATSISQVVTNIQRLTGMHVGDVLGAIKPDNLKIDKGLTEAERKMKSFEDAYNKLVNHQKNTPFGEIYSESNYQKDLNKLKRILYELTQLKQNPMSLSEANAWANLINKEFARSNMNIKGQNNGISSYEKNLRELNQIWNLVNKIHNLETKSLNHSGVGGKFYSAEQLAADKNNLALYKEALERIISGRNEKITDYMPNGINMNMFDKVNVGNAPASISGQLNKQIEQARLNAERLYAELQKTGSVADKVRFMNGVRELHQLQAASSKLNEELKSTESIFSRIKTSIGHSSQWMMQMYVANQLLQMPSSLIHGYTELEQAMAGVKQVMPAIENSTRLMSENMDEYTKRTERANQETQNLIHIAHEYARATDEVVEAATLWGRGYGKKENADGFTKSERESLSKELAESMKDSGLDDSQQAAVIREKIDALEDEQRALNAVATTNELVRQSAMLATVDNFSMAESVKGLEAILAAYDMRARSAAEATAFAGRAVDIVSKVAHNGQISAQDLVRGIEATGKAAQQAGISLSFLSAMIETGARNTGKSGAEIGNAIKALTVGIHSTKGEKELAKFGIELSKVGEDGQKHLRSAQSVILDIAEALQKGEKNAEKMLMAISGGRYQYSKVSAILKDESEMIRMWGLAASSAGFAQEQLDIQMNTINSKLKQVKSSLESLMQSAIGGGLGDVAKTLLVNVDKLIQGISSFGGVLAKAPQIAGFLALLKIIPKITSSINLATTALQNYKAAAQAEGNTNAGARSALWSAAKQKTTEKFTGTNPAVANTQATNANTQATNANTASKSKNTVAENTNSASKNKNTTSTQANTAAERTSTVSHVANAGAMKAEAVAAETATAATRALTVAETFLTAGLNIAIGMVAVLAYNLMTAEDETKETIESLKGLNQVTGENEESVAEHIDKLQQEIGAYKEQQDWMDNGIKMYTRLRQEINDTTLSEEKREEKIRHLDDVCSAWNSMMEEYAKNTGESFDKINSAMENSGEVMEAQKEKYKRIYKEKKELLAKAKKQQTDFYENQVKWFTLQKGWYKTNLENFDVWSSKQGEGLNWLQSIWAKFFSSIASGMRGAARIMADLKTQFMPKGDGNSSPLNAIDRFLDEFVSNRFNDAEYAFNKAADAAVWLGTETPIAPLSEMVRSSEAALRDYQLKLAESEWNEIKEMFGTDDDNSVYDDTDDGKKGKGSGSKSHSEKKIKIDEASSEEYKTYHNMLLNRKEISDMGYDFYDLMAFKDAIASLGLDKSKYKGAFGITDEIYQKYNAETPIDDFMTNGALFSEAFSDLYGKQRSAVGAMMEMWGISEEDAIALTNKIQEAGKANKDAYEISNAYKDHIFSGTIVESKANTKDTHQLVEEAAKNLIGQTMDLHGVGCVEAVEKVGSYYSEFLKDSYDRGIRGVPSLIDYAKEQGVQVIAYDESQLDSGDVVVWRDPSQENDQDHVGVYTHTADDGTLMGVDNSSSRDEVVERALHTGDRVGQYIIKTGLDSISNKLSWHRDGKENPENLSQYRLTSREIREGYERDERSRIEKRFSIREAEIKRMQSDGEIAKASTENLSLLSNKLSSAQKNYADQLKIASATMAGLTRFSKKNTSFKEWLDSQGVKAKDLSIDQLKEVARLLKAQKDEGAESFEKIVNSMEKLGLDKNGNSVAVDEAKNKVEEAKHNLFSAYGRKSPDAQYEFDRAKAELDYKLAEAEIKSQRSFGKNESLNDAKRVMYQEKINAALKEEQRLRGQLMESKKNDLLVQKELLEEIERIRKEIKEVEESDKNDEEKTKALEKLNKELEEAKENLNALSINGSEATQTLTNKWKELTVTIKNTQKEMLENVGKVSKATADAIGDAFDDLLLEGKSLQDIVRNILKDIAKVALRNIVYKSFGLVPSATNTWTDAIIGGIDRRQRKTPASQLMSTLSASGFNVNAGWGALGNNNKPNELSSKIDNLSNAISISSEMQQATKNATDALTMSTQASTLATQTETIATEQNTIQGTINTTTKITADASNTVSENLSRSMNTTATNMNSTAVTNAATQVSMASATAGAGKAGKGGFGGGIIGAIFSIGSTFLGRANGGAIPRFATGGYTDGLIKGAGTGTSDSILTYLANRGQFIKTSNGEFIMQKKAVDKLGVNFLNILNSNPEVLDGLKKYANGGALGYELTTNISPKAVNSYKNFTRMKGEDKSSSNKRLEELMQQQTNVIANKDNGGGAGKLVVLNTQADSTAVLKALKDNPRAVQKILGNQQKHGFR
jgi:hypothetical protein